MTNRVFKTEVNDIGLEFDQLIPPNVFSNEFFRKTIPTLQDTKSNQWEFINIIGQLDLAEEFEIMKLLLMAMKGEDTIDKRVFNYLKHNIEFTNILNETFILPIKDLEKYLDYMEKLRTDILANFNLINIGYDLEDDSLNTYYVFIADYFIGTVKNMIKISKEAFSEDLINGKPNNQLIAIFIKIRNNNLYFTTPAKYDTDYKDLIIINPEAYTVELWDSKFYLKGLFTPALISDKDLKEVKSYLTHMTGTYKNLKRNMKRKDLDKITSRIIEDEIREKQELRNHYKLEL